MNEKELKRLNRSELLEMLIAQMEENEQLRQELDEIKAERNKKEVILDNAGSIAEAALQLNGVFEAAQAACQQYIDNIRQLNEKTETDCTKMKEESCAEAERMLAEAERQRTDRDRETESVCAEMIQKAKRESQKYWEDVSEKLEAYYAAHTGLRELLAVPTSGRE